MIPPIGGAAGSILPLRPLRLAPMIRMLRPPVVPSSAILVVIGLLVLGAPLAFPTATAQSSPPQDDYMVHLGKIDGEPAFVPNRLLIVPGGTVQLMIFGGGPNSLTLTDVEGYDADIPTEAEGVRTAEFRAPMEQGTYAFHDKYVPERRGVLVVQAREDESAAESPASTPTVRAGSGYDTTFYPDRLEVAPGAEFLFEVPGEIVHTLTARDGSFNVERVANRTVSLAAPAAEGEYPFYCQYHEGMEGVLVVREGAAGAPPAESADDAPDEREAATPPARLSLTLMALVLVGWAVALRRDPRA